jgi:Icc-related predicted phosphoesterase
MPIACISNINGDKENLAKFAEQVIRDKGIEAVLYAGNTLGEPIFTPEETCAIIDSINLIASHVTTNMPLNLLLEILSRGKGKVPDELRRAADIYLTGVDKFDEHAKEIYQEPMIQFRKIKQSGKMVFAVPGAAESGKHYEEYLREFSIDARHLNGKAIRHPDGTTIIGYGGAKMTPGWIPFTRTVLHDDSEQYRLFVEKNPDIILTHMMPGETPCPTSPEETGSPKTLEYIRTSPEIRNLELLICGQCPELRGHSVESGVTVINPGNLGKTKDSKEGYFAIVELSDSNPPAVEHYQL